MILRTLWAARLGASPLAAPLKVHPSGPWIERTSKEEKVVNEGS